MALEGARHAVPLAKVTTIYTDGNEDFAKDVSAAVAGTDRMVVDTRPIEKLSQSPSGAEVTVHFKDGSTKVEGFLAAHLNTKTRGPFAEQLGLEMTPGGDVKTAPPFSATNVKGVFAVGDCGQSMKVIPAAAASGNAAAAACSSQVLAVSLGQKPLF
jgi:thioredoxin reductase